MIFADIPSGASVFFDANTLLYAFSSHGVLGAPCDQLLDRVANQDVTGFISTHVIGDTIHRLMTIEACLQFGWPVKGIAGRLRQHPAEVQKLAKPKQARGEIQRIGLQVLPVTALLAEVAVDVIQLTGLLFGDALIVAVMRAHGLIHLASNDADFDRVPGFTRYGPS
jgi:predicted nucleic acid-binding protein